ncbi:unnamed protein product [Caenorhabditis angaria]|uniref:Uncharacterized protein n=1 Tax=Caenorhabditis angaria TaxID=860376 RepID=A0A9P1J886_9PELO|nr:unnamed protein product [Caenorhabditis angaria]
MFGQIAKIFGCCKNKKKEVAKPQLAGLKINKQPLVKPAKPTIPDQSFTGQTTESIGCWLYESERAGSPQEVTPLAVVAIEDEELAVEATQRD